jgi:hypothetical protein
MIAFIVFLACVWWLASALDKPTSAEIWYAEGKKLARERRREEREERRAREGSPWMALWIVLGAIALTIVLSAFMMRMPPPH